MTFLHSLREWEVLLNAHVDSSDEIRPFTFKKS